MVRTARLVALLLGPLLARAGDAPTPPMLDAANALATCMARGLPDDCAIPFASHGVVIAENFPPYYFVGAKAVERWRAGFRRHLATGGAEHLAYRFGDARDFSRHGSRIYFSLPTVWTGTSGTRRFEEPGGWSFVLIETPAGVRILGYAWAVTDLQVVP
jgi:hypothetical protein